MKKLTILLAIVLTSTLSKAQAPDKMSYQAVIRNASNALVTNQSVGMQISILQGTVSGPAVYVEQQTPSTNINGLVSLEVGTGTVVSGTFNTIDWSAGPYFIKTETDPSGGTSYSMTGTNQLLSVPYALHANTASSALGDKLILLEIKAGGNTTTTSGVSGLGLIKFNKNNYLNVDSITFISTPYVGDASNSSIVELLNISDNVNIANATLSSNQTTFIMESSYLETGNIYDDLPNGEVSLGLRVKSATNGMFAGVGSSYIAIYKK